MEMERKVMGRVMKRIVPFLMICYLFAFLDRVNIGFAALTMNRDLGISATAFGLAAGVFFLTYFLLEVPSNVALVRFGARRWIARIMITWGGTVRSYSIRSRCRQPLFHKGSPW